MVGTIEPRKATPSPFRSNGCSAGVDVRRIVGKPGVDGRRPREADGASSSSGKRLFWLKGIGDAYLEEVYAASTCLLASEWKAGLPLIEPIKLAILARDIRSSVVAGEHRVFRDMIGRPRHAVGDWLAVQKWAASAFDACFSSGTQQLLDVIMRERWAIRWPAVASRHQPSQAGRPAWVRRRRRADRALLHAGCRILHPVEVYVSHVAFPR
jgi:hypothetical protein